MKRTPAFGRGAAWITPQGEVFHCGLQSHASVFQQNYKGKRIDPATVKDHLDDVHRAVARTGWIRVLSPCFDVQRINPSTLGRIRRFLLAHWDTNGQGHDLFWVEDAKGRRVRLAADSLVVR